MDVTQSQYFVDESSVVRKIWGRADTILFIFAGASAEFALNKAVDWLYFTGKLPSDPIARLFSTVAYAKGIVFADSHKGRATIDTIRNIHRSVEGARGFSIPDWAYRDVLFMLIHYSIASYELLERKLSGKEKQEVYHVFRRVGERMDLEGLPASYNDWLPVREAHMLADLHKSPHTADLFKRYKQQLGGWRFWILKEVQKLVVPRRVGRLLYFGRLSLLAPFLPVYKLLPRLNADRKLRDLLLPAKYRAQINGLDLED